MHELSHPCKARRWLPRPAALHALWHAMKYTLGYRRISMSMGVTGRQQDRR